MSDTAFDTLGAARRLKAAGIGAGQAEAIVEVMGQSVNQLVTGERFEAGITVLQSRIDVVQTELQTRIDRFQTDLQTRTDTFQTDLQTRIDAVRTDMRAEIARSHLFSVGIMVAANALMMTMLGYVLTRGG